MSATGTGDIWGLNCAGEIQRRIVRRIDTVVTLTLATRRQGFTHEDITWFCSLSLDARNSNRPLSFVHFTAAGIGSKVPAPSGPIPTF